MFLQLQDLRKENLRLNEVLEKDDCDVNTCDNIDCINGPNIGYSFRPIADYGIPSWDSSFSESGTGFEDLLMHRDGWEHENKGKSRNMVFLKPGSKAARPYPFSPRIINKKSMVDEALDRERGIALSQSLFSTILSLLVGMIIWEAEDPCMSLVVALFAVVGMSVKSVIQFLSTVKNRPASDAIALLSFNCFLLGTLTPPTFPTVARMLAPLAFRLVISSGGNRSPWSTPRVKDNCVQY
ncbi:hypothetical protein AAC387_Pa06g0237 [Persea americana]